MRVFGLFISTLLLTVTACSTVKVAERGMDGGALFGTASNSRTVKNSTVAADAETEMHTRIEQRRINVEKNSVEVTHESQQLKPLLTSKPAGKVPETKLIKTARKITKKLASQKAPYAILHKDNPEEGSIRWFIYLLLCFIIPPFAYYLIKRESDTPFWICFFCFLLVLSFVGGFSYGLLGLLSIVIALMALFQIEI